MTNTAHPWLRRLSILIVGLTLLLIFVGALVKSHEAGLSVPDWPTTYGQNMFTYPLSQMVGGIFYEHGHRLLASGLGFLVIIMVILALIYEPRKWVRRLSIACLGTVILQGIFGGLTVLFFLPPTISIIHGVLAQTFFILTIILAYSFSKEHFRRLKHDHKYSAIIRRGAVSIGILVYFQLILGALMRHTASGMAIPDFPSMGGFYWPPFNADMLANINADLFDLDRDMVNMGQVIIHFIHRAGALIVTGGILFWAYKIYRLKIEPSVRYTLILILSVVISQVVLGVVTVLSDRAPYIASFHVVTGAALLGLCTLMVLRVISPLKQESL